MSAVPPDPARAAHQDRRTAESFGIDPGGYDAARPGYPEELVSRIVTRSPGRRVLDVGCGTGIAARQFQAAGCEVLGLEPDARMADFARSRGLEVEVTTFEDWAPAGRVFDAVIAAQSWHWVDPVAGAAAAARALRPGGLLAIFGHAYEPPIEVAEPMAAALARLMPDSPFADQPARRPVETYQAMYAAVGEKVQEGGHFVASEQWRFDWERDYTRDEWLALLPTTGGLTRLPPEQVTAILDEVGRAIDALGGGFTMQYATLATTAVRAAEG